MSDETKVPQPPAEAQRCPCGQPTCVEPWEPGCGLGNSDEQVAVEAQAVAQGGDAELRHMVAKLAAHVRPTCSELWAEAERLLNSTAPPSAPVGVEAVRDALRKAFRFGETHWQQADSEHTSQHRKADETMATFKAWADETAAALAKQPAAVDEAWQVQLADALECFWNPAIEGSGDDRSNIIGGMVQGFAAVAYRLREHASLAAQQGGES